MTDQNSELLAARYGQTKSLSKKTQRGLAVFGVAAITVVAIYFGLANYKGLEYQEISFSVIDNRAVELEFEISKPQDSTAICTLQALNEQFGVVGHKVIEVGPQSTQTVRLSASINTIELATTALVDDCVLK